jgi:hypothetical protein
MLFEKQSHMTGKFNTMEIPVTKEEVLAWMHSDRHIQDVFPTLSAEQREFLMTGSTPGEWNAIFGPEE